MPLGVEKETWDRQCRLRGCDRQVQRYGWLVKILDDSLLEKYHYQGYSVRIWKGFLRVLRAKAMLPLVLQKQVAALDIVPLV